MKKLTASLTKTGWEIIGDATPGGWDKGTVMNYDPATKLWSVDVTLVAGEMKFRWDGAWTVNLGGSLGALTQDGSVVGNVGIFPIGERFKVRHRASLGIAVVQEYWNTGLGTVLINGAIDLARKAGYEQLELGVFSDNSSALHLYQKLGFQEVGRMPNAFKLPDGSYADEIMMVLPFTNAS